MKRNKLGIVTAVLCFFNILYTLSLFIFFSYDALITGYMIGGTILSAALVYLIIKNNKFGYLGTAIFYGLQIIGTSYVFQNYRYGFGIQVSKPLEFISANCTIDINIIAFIIALFGILGYRKLKSSR